MADGGNFGISTESSTGDEIDRASRGDASALRQALANLRLQVGQQVQTLEARVLQLEEAVETLRHLGPL